MKDDLIRHTHVLDTKHTVHCAGGRDGEGKVLFPLSGARWFGCEVIENPGDTRDSPQLLNHLRKHLQGGADSTEHQNRTKQCCAQSVYSSLISRLHPPEVTCTLTTPPALHAWGGGCLGWLGCQS